MRKLALIPLLVLLLGGCAEVQTAWSVVTGTQVSATQILVIANAFDAAEATATQYLNFCKSTVPVPSYCVLATRKSVVSAVRAGRAARMQLEPYIVSGDAGPAALYNTLVAAVTSLQNQIPPLAAASGSGLAPMPAPKSSDSGMGLLPLLNQ
jgi:hypothetical protein